MYVPESWIIPLTMLFWMRYLSRLQDTPVGLYTHKTP